MTQEHIRGPVPVAPRKTYTKMAITLHWIMALPFILLLLFGLPTMGNHYGRFWPTVHVSTGFALLALVVLRAIWRWRYPPPPLPTAMSKPERWLAWLSHFALYAVMVLMPLSGWFAYTEHVHRTMGVQSARFFWLSKIPLLPDFGINFHFIHKLSSYIALALIAIHILAAFKHHFWDRDEVLLRILFKQREKSRI